MPTPIDDPPGASPFAPLWAAFVQGAPGWSEHAPALARFQAWWGAPLAADLEQWLAHTGDGIRPLRRVTADEDAFAWLLASTEPLDWQLVFGGLLGIAGPGVSRAGFYAVVDPSRPTTRVICCNLGFDPGDTVALDLPSFWALARACPSDVPPDEGEDEDDALREAAAGMALADGRWSGWLDEIADRLDPTATPGTCSTKDLPDAMAQLTRAQPLIDVLLHARPFAGPPLDRERLAAELEAHPDFADFPPRALYWLWLAALTGDRPTLERLRERLGGSRSKLVRDALVHALARTDA